MWQTFPKGSLCILCEILLKPSRNFEYVHMKKAKKMNRPVCQSKLDERQTSRSEMWSNYFIEFVIVLTHKQSYSEFHQYQGDL